MPAPAQSRRGAWFALSVLFAINLLNFYDRQIPAAVTKPILTEWKLSLTSMGVLGTAFVLIYAAVGVPLGRLADRYSRTRILGVGVTVWSLLTAASGMTWDYASMFVTRLGVGVGEASCAPAANSLVGDLFPPRQRARALAIFMLGLPIGIFLSNTISGWLAEHANWRTAFYVACIPGLLCGAATFLIREPVRGGSETCDTGLAGLSRPRPQRPGSPYVVVLGTPTIVWIIVSGALHNFNMYATNSFLPTLIEIRHQQSHSRAGLIAGIVLGAVGIVGMLGGGLLADLRQRSRPNGRLQVASAAMFLSAPLIYLGLDQAPGSIAGFMIFLGTGVMFMYVYYASVYAAIQDVIEPGLRGTAMALYFFAMYLVGGAFGSSVTGKLSDVLSRRAMTAAGVTVTDGPIPEHFQEIGLHQAFYVVPALCVGLGIVLFAASRTVARDMRKLEDWYDEAERVAARGPATVEAGEAVSSR
ncbi:MAG TPA: MFS transporter [Planctomycetaceae bacterium]|jgi:MFS family permease|nr:MFS transporter [Planctomycetaceae bacterium]